MRKFQSNDYVSYRYRQLAKSRSHWRCISRRKLLKYSFYFYTFSWKEIFMIYYISFSLFQLIILQIVTLNNLKGFSKWYDCALSLSWFCCCGLLCNGVIFAPLSIQFIYRVMRDLHLMDAQTVFKWTIKIYLLLVRHGCK